MGYSQWKQEREEFERKFIAKCPECNERNSEVIDIDEPEDVSFLKYNWVCKTCGCDYETRGKTGDVLYILHHGDCYVKEKDDKDCNGFDILKKMWGGGVKTKKIPCYDD